MLIPTNVQGVPKNDSLTIENNNMQRETDKRMKSVVFHLKIYTQWLFMLVKTQLVLLLGFKKSPEGGG